MKSTGVTRPVDALGRFVLPSEIRTRYDIQEKDLLEIYTEGDKIVLKKCQPCCTFCGEENNITSFKGKLICSKCIEDIASL